ncbi:sugar transferase [Pseudovibrio exalbescens]|uniref:sugar transferase n=1 Tax=Pseudovibrio exalbescens TaxID=197461 RepID=UPI0023654F3B|nr:sugar transferase [Pseudovibrio exalbescens]MDD7909226.1 sugar transferase [Pseudovibrio exalbescens]
MTAELVALGSGALMAYHGLVYPAVLRQMASRSEPRQPKFQKVDRTQPPSIEVIIPAYNEAPGIAAKLRNCAQLDYPAGQLKVSIIFDGCTDETYPIAKRTLKELQDEGLSTAALSLSEWHYNRGKVAVLNQAISESTADIIVLTDVSAVVEPDALWRVADEFADPDVGVVCATYELETEDSGEHAYWSYQRWLKEAEASVAAPFGAHGAFYAIRRSAWRAIPPSTINDDVLIPMQIVEDGYRAIYDLSLVATETEAASRETDLRRRLRIGAGNLQQAIWLWRLADLKKPALAFIYLSGKGLRAFTPILMVAFLLSCAVLALQGALLAQLVMAGVLVAMAVNIYEAVTDGDLPKLLRPFSAVGYALGGQVAAFLGCCQYVFGARKPWRRAADNTGVPDFIHPLARMGKRVMDVTLAVAAFVVMAILFVPLAIIIKLDSPGPIFYRQYRVGERLPDRTNLFLLTKFRSMRTDAEKHGAQWATKGDPRVTRIGRFLRKSRLDELPQCLNVLRGEMSVVGPRPERPVFFERLEDQIPFYIERTYGLRPGITGLAQVEQGYDEDVEDVRSKVMHDHAYAMQLVTPWEWFKTDLSIILRTFVVMVTGRGQ